MILFDHNSQGSRHFRYLCGDLGLDTVQSTSVSSSLWQTDKEQPGPGYSISPIVVSHLDQYEALYTIYITPDWTLELDLIVLLPRYLGHFPRGADLDLLPLRVYRSTASFNNTHIHNSNTDNEERCETVTTPVWRGFRSLHALTVCPHLSPLTFNSTD